MSRPEAPPPARARAARDLVLWLSVVAAGSITRAGVAECGIRPTGLVVASREHGLAALAGGWIIAVEVGANELAKFVRPLLLRLPDPGRLVLCVLGSVGRPSIWMDMLHEAQKAEAQDK